MKIMDKDHVSEKIYGPNSDNPQFFSTLQEQISQLQNSNIIIGGDRNLVLNATLIYHNCRHNNSVKAEQKNIEMLGDLELTGVLRELTQRLLDIPGDSQTLHSKPGLICVWLQKTFYSVKGFRDTFWIQK